MATSKSTDGLTSLMVLLARLALGAWFLVHGYGVLDGVGSAGFVDLHLAHARELLPEGLARSYLIGLPYTEIAAGALLVIGLLTRVAALLGAILLCAGLLGATGMGWRFELGAAAPFSPELVMLALALLLVALGSGSCGLDRRFGGGKSKPSSAE
jgi:putative oxidoreductase